MIQMNDFWSRLNSDGTPQQPGDLLYSEGALQESVMRSIARILNTRCPLSDQQDIVDSVKDTVVNYGLIELDDLSPGSPAGLQAVSARVERAVRFFEPRLVDVSVDALDQPDDKTMVVRLVLSASIDPRIVKTAVDLKAELYPASNRVEISPIEQIED